MDGSPGNFELTVRSAPRYVTDDCDGCGLCQDACPILLDDTSPQPGCELTDEVLAKLWAPEEDEEVNGDGQADQASETDEAREAPEAAEAPETKSLIGFSVPPAKRPPRFQRKAIHPASPMPQPAAYVVEREHCPENCRACADICPTRALHINDEGELVLADYYCIKCGACMQVCPVKPEYEEYEVTVESQGVTKTIVHQRVTNVEELPIWVERWRVRHQPVQSAAWITALVKMADDKAGAVEIDSKRALKRRDLLKALAGGKALVGVEK